MLSWDTTFAMSGTERDILNNYFIHIVVEMMAYVAYVRETDGLKLLWLIGFRTAA